MSIPPILFVLLQTGNRANGGLESITEIMVRLRRFRPIVITNLESTHSSKWRCSGIETHVVPDRVSLGIRADPAGYVATHLRYYYAVKRLIAQTGARVIHANDPHAFQLAVAAVKTSVGARIALNLRGSIDPDRRPPSFRYRAYFRAADHVFYLSEEQAAHWARVARNARRSCTVTYSIVDPARFSPAPPPLGERPVVLISGVVRPLKGQLEFLINAAPGIVTGGADVWFAGDFDPANDSYSAACAAAAKPLGEAVRFVGFREDLPDLIARSTVIAIPSRNEGLARTMIEAMSCARPVVSFDVPSAREILHEQSGGAGVVIPLGNFAKMREAILAFCRDPASAAAAGQAGARTALRLFAPENVVERYERAYAELINT